MKKEFILLAACLIFAACGSNSAENKAENSTASSIDEEVIYNNKVQEETAKPTPEPKKKTDELPKFKEGEPYKSVREKLIGAGWKTFASPDADECFGDDERCKDYPEMQSCAGTGLGNCRYTWQKDGKTLLIFTVGDMPVYHGQELQKVEKPTKANEVAGKYIYRYTHDSGYDEFIYELKSDGTATFKSNREGGDGRDLNGTWDESEGIVTTVFKNEDGKIEKTEFSIEKSGNLKQLTDPNSNENVKGFEGTIFIKQ